MRFGRLIVHRVTLAEARLRRRWSFNEADVILTAVTEEAEMKKQKFPPGWDEKRVNDVIAHYENQSEDEEFAEIEASLEADDITLMAIPTTIVPEVRALLARKHSA